MEHCTTEKHVVIVKLFYQNIESVIVTIREEYSTFGRENVPNSSTVNKTI